MSDILINILLTAVGTIVGACIGFFTAALLNAAKDRPPKDDKNE